MRKIQLTRGKTAFVDDADYERVVAVGRWSAAKRRNTWYAVNGRDYHLVYMHRFILGLTNPKIKVDHEDRDGLNNQQKNLRKSSNAENCRNQEKRSKNSSSQFKGVSLFKHHFLQKPWAAAITVLYKKIHLGYFQNETEAALAYNVAALKYYGKYASLNCIEEKRLTEE